MAVASRSLRFGVLEAVLLAAFGCGGYVLWTSDADAREIVSRERVAYARVEALLAAEARFRDERRRDDDRDGVGEYGSLADLVAAGFDPGPVASDADGTYLAVSSYRIEILLPTGVHRATGRREWGRGRAVIDPRLAAATFAVVASPVLGQPRVLRGFYVDAARTWYYAEGVHESSRDPSVEPPIRELRDPKEFGGHERGAAWRILRGPGADDAR